LEPPCEITENATVYARLLKRSRTPRIQLFRSPYQHLARRLLAMMVAAQRL
jgi:hypothetical protein